MNWRPNPLRFMVVATNPHTKRLLEMQFGRLESCKEYARKIEADGMKDVHIVYTETRLPVDS